MQHYGQALEVLFYEVLDMPLREYEQLKHMKVLLSCSSPLVNGRSGFRLFVITAACLGS